MGCRNPQKILVSPNGKALYLACSASQTVAVFTRNTDGWRHTQSVTHESLKGAGSLALSPDGRYLYAAGEAGAGLLIFDVLENGELCLNTRFNLKAKPINGITSIAVSKDGKHLLLSLAKDDALYVLKRQ